MNVHQNARLTPLGRERLVGVIAQGMSFARAGSACGCSAKTAAKWWKRFRHGGRKGLQDRRSRPHSLRNPTPDDVAERIISLRRERLTGAHIAAKVGVSPATVSRVLRRAGLSRLRDLEPAEPVRRYECEHPGEMIHLDALVTLLRNALPGSDQASWQVRKDRPPHHGRPDRPVEQPRDRLGIRSCLHR